MLQRDQTIAYLRKAFIAAHRHLSIYDDKEFLAHHGRRKMETIYSMSEQTTRSIIPH